MRLHCTDLWLCHYKMEIFVFNQPRKRKSGEITYFMDRLGRESDSDFFNIEKKRIKFRMSSYTPQLVCSNILWRNKQKRRCYICIPYTHPTPSSHIKLYSNPSHIAIHLSLPQCIADSLEVLFHHSTYGVCDIKINFARELFGECTRRTSHYAALSFSLKHCLQKSLTYAWEP